MRRTSLAIILAGLLSSAVLAAGESEEGRLHWSNGDSLPGELLDAQGPQLRWQSPLFARPLTIQSKFLRWVTLPAREGDHRARGAFRFVMRNGDVLYGELLSIDGSHVTFTSPRHGQVRARRDAVATLQRIDGASLIYLGPTGTEGWGTLKDRTNALGWAANPAGHLSSSISRAELFRAIDIPGRAVVELTLASSQMPQFLLAFGDQPTRTVRLETWADELVALAGDDFEPIVTMQASTRKVELRLYWDQAKGELSAYSGSGKKFATLAGAKAIGSDFGIYLQNKGANLSLVRLQVSKWDGTPPREVKLGDSRLHLVSGDIEYGPLTTVKDGQVTLSGRDEPIPLDQVGAIHWTDETSPAGSLPVRVTYYDGTLVSGAIQAIAGGKVRQTAAFTDQPIESDLAGARMISFSQQPASPVDGTDTLHHPGGVSRGSLVGGDEPGAAVLWRPVGGINASPLAPGCKGRFVRGEPARDEPGYDRSKFRDVLCLTTRDIVPCRLLSIDEQFVHVETAFGNSTQVPHDQVQAIELGLEGELHGGGFAGGGWRDISVAEGAVELKGERITFVGKGGYGHGSILNGDEVKFQAKWDRRKPAFLTVRLFAADLNKSQGAVDLGFYFAADQVRVAQQTGGQLRFQNQIGRGELGQAQFKITLQGKLLQVTANDQVVFSTNIDPTKRGGKGLLFSNAIATTMSGRMTGPVTLSNLEVSMGSGVHVGRYVDPEAKLHALTVPRFRRKNPFTHILLAHNGDLLRGRMNSLIDGQVRFQSRLDDFNFPRKLIATIVWLHEGEAKPDDDGDPQADGNPQVEAGAEDAEAAGGNDAAQDSGEEAVGDLVTTAEQADTADGPSATVPVAVKHEPGEAVGPHVRVLLAGGEIVVVVPERMDEELLVGQSPVLGLCKIPVASIRELQLGDHGPLEPGLGYADWKLIPAPEPKFAGGPGGSSAAQPGGELVGTVAKEFGLKTLRGKQFQLGEQAGRVLVLDFWATWCGPCVRAMPEYQRVLKGFDPKKVSFLAVNQAETPDTINAFLKTHPDWKLNVLLDSNQQVARQFKVEGIPHTVLIGKDGKIEWIHTGFRPGVEEELQAAVERVLGEKAKPAAE